MKATQVGVNLDVAQKRGSGIKILPEVQTRAYVEAKYEGLPENIQRHILHPYFQYSLKEGIRGAI